MLSLKIDEAEEIIEGLLAYRRHLSRRREFANDDHTRRTIGETIVKTDRIIHQLDLRVAAAKDVANNA